jgi:hypothetical protein
MADPPDEYCCPLSFEIMVRGSLVSAFLWLRVGTVVRSFHKSASHLPPHTDKSLPPPATIVLQKDPVMDPEGNSFERADIEAW